MSVALDTNVIVTVVGGTPAASERALHLLREYGSRSGFVISPIVYAELFAHAGWGLEDIGEFLTATGIAVDWELTRSVWEQAGQAFGQYARRRRRESAAHPRRLLADFVIGSHALKVGALMTSDADFYRRNFPDLRVVGV